MPGPKKILGRKKVRAGRKKLAPKKFGPKIAWARYEYGPKKRFGQKKSLGPKKVWVQRKFAPKKRLG